MFREVLLPNKENCNPNVNIAKQLKPLVSSKIAEELILENKFKVVQRQVVERFVSQNPVSVEGIQSAMDETGIRHNGYGFLQKKVISSFKSRGIKPKLLPTPGAVWRHKKYLTSSRRTMLENPITTMGSSKQNRAWLSMTNTIIFSWIWRCYRCKWLSFTTSLMQRKMEY